MSYDNDDRMVAADKIAKFIEDVKDIIAVFDPKGEIKVSRSEALEWWDKARIANKRRGGTRCIQE